MERRKLDGTPDASVWKPDASQHYANASVIMRSDLPPSAFAPAGANPNNSPCGANFKFMPLANIFPIASTCIMLVSEEEKTRFFLAYRAANDAGNGPLIQTGAIPVDKTVAAEWSSGTSVPNREVITASIRDRSPRPMPLGRALGRAK